jgi:hypothetical protein
MKHKPLSTLIVLGLALLLIIGCQAAAQPAPTIQPPAADPTELPAEATGTAALAEPTPTPEPLPELSLETLVGTWNQFDDQAGGENWFLFHEDGTYQGKHGPSPETGVLVTEGTFTLEGNVVTFFDATHCPDGESHESRYITVERIRFDLIGSTCSEPLLPEKPIWKKVTATE